MCLLEYRVNGDIVIDKTRFQDLEYAEDIALLAEMSEILQLLFDVTTMEAQKLGLSINPDKIKSLF